MRHVRLDRAADVAGKVGAPQTVGDPLGGHELPAGEDQHGEDGTLTAAAEVDLGIAVAGVEPAEDPDPEPVAACHLTSPALPGSTVKEGRALRAETDPRLGGGTRGPFPVRSEDPVPR